MSRGQNSYYCMKIFKLTETCGLFYEKDDYIGAVHAIIEALYNVFTEKSWDKIISITVDPDTFEGVVEYEDSILDGQDEKKLMEIHRDCYIAARIMNKYLDYGYRPNSDLFRGFVLGYMESVDEFDEKYDILQTYAYSCSNYISFIEEVASRLIPGITFTGQNLKEWFNRMGFSLPKI